MSADELIASVSRRLVSDGSVGLAQVFSPTLKAWLLINLKDTPDFAETGCLVVSEDDLERQQLLNNFYFFQQIYDLPDIIDCQKNTGLALFGLASGQKNFFLINQSKLLTNLPNFEQLQQDCPLIKTGQALSLQKFFEKINEIGYARQPKIYLPGETARRGNIIDIFGPQDKLPVRIEFTNQAITRLYQFDPLSQKIYKIIEQYQIIPLTFFESNGNASLADYLLPHTLIVASSLPASLNQKKYRKIFWHQLKQKNSLVTDFIPSPNFQHQPAQLFKELNKKPDWNIIFAGKHLPLNKQKNIKHLHPATDVSAFINSKYKLWLLTDSEIEQPEVKETKPEKNLAQLSDLEAGDYVVHLDHGIARFGGLVRQNIDGFDREYFLLNYAEGDKLWLPVERADKITKYIGLSRPTLHRLSGTSWVQALNKIKKETLATARRLIDISAHRQLAKTDSITTTTPREDELAADFPFQETPDQELALADINTDLSQPRPMDRLICGDVGFGKTEVALRTAFKIILNGGQVALLCPTTILAQQHFDNFQNRLKKFNIKVALLSRFRSQKEQLATVKQINDGQIDIVIGTHRLLSPDINFKKLSLLIIDEEQKFGVRHKEQINGWRAWVHVLTLSATPIPRTLYQSLTGLKAVSLINTPPVGRLPIKTYIQPFAWPAIKAALELELKRHGQAYYLYNKVESIELKLKQLKNLLPQARLAVAHGQLPSARLAEVMHRFDQGEIDILVCSTIIENGLDLPNVNTLIVEQSAHFGLAQLYQLRGRVGRADRQAYSYFFYSSGKLAGSALKRLQALESAQELGEGFKIAQRDMEIRGIGNLLGKEQHGQAKTVGLNLYLMLLEQAVAEITSGRPAEIMPEVTIDLPLTYSIPNALAAKPGQKFSLYQKLANFKTADQLDRFTEKNFSRPLPQEFSNLLEILKIKILCQSANITAIDSIYPRGEEIKIILYPDQELASDKLAKLLQDNFAWQYKNNKLKINKDRLGENWIKKLEHSLEILK